MPEKKLKKQPSQKKKEVGQKPTLFEKINRWFENNHLGLMVTLCTVSFIFSLLLFDVKISEGGDDATYIEAAYNYANDFFNYHFTYNAPLYPMLLSIPVKIFGINLKILKFTSVIFSLLHLIFLFLAFNKRIPNVILFPALFVVAINSYFLYFASQTYNEAFFLFTQSFFFYSFFRIYKKHEQNNSLSENWKQWLLVGFALFLIALAKNIAVISVPIAMFFFLLQKQIKPAFFILASFLIFRIPYEVFRIIVWATEGQGVSQFEALMRKDHYHPEKGYEDLAGFATRFLDNAGLYFSRRLMQILNFKSEMNNNIFHLETIIVTALLLLGFVAILRAKNKYLLMCFVYSVLMICASFIVLQTQWDQPRLVLIFVPFILFISFSGFYFFLEKLRKNFLQFIFFIAVVVVVFFSLTPTIKKAKANLPVLKKNIRGDLYYGYTPDWANFLQMSEWCAKNLPDTAYVVSRKPSMSFIYSGGKKFYPVYMVTTLDPDSVLMELKENKVTHALIATLRKDKTKIADSTNVINTVHRMLKPVVDKYPQSLTLVHKIGEKETAYLLKINYPELNQPEKKDAILIK